MKTQQSGFTLIEIAIVLVIIGLILGGVLKGQELITQAKIRNVANDFNGISAAYYSYQDRYRAMPGDDPNAASRWTTSTSGGGNATLTGYFDATPASANPTATEETNLFWQHLRLAGLVAGPTSGAGSGNPPQNAVGGVTGVQSGPLLNLNGLVICSTNLPGKVANAIDSQFDDGNPQKGQVRAEKQATTSTLPKNADPSITAYVDDGSTLYVVCKNM